jgi:hypothetical protein
MVMKEFAREVQNWKWKREGGDCHRVKTHNLYMGSLPCNDNNDCN